MISFNDVTNFFKKNNWSKGTTTDYLVIYHSNKTSIILDKKIVDDKVGYMITQLKDYNEVIDHGEIEDIMELIEINKTYGGK